MKKIQMMTKAGLVLMVVVIRFGLLVGGVEAHNTLPSYTQESFWFLDDDASAANAEDETGFGAGNVAQDTNITGVVKNSVFMYRTEVAETANQDQSLSLIFTLQYKLASGGACADTSGWTDVTTSSGNAFQITAATSITEPYTTTVNRLTNAYTTDLPKGALLDASNSHSAFIDAKGAEVQWAIKATSDAADSTAYLLRATDNSSQTGLNVYTRCGQVTTAAAASPSFSQFEYKWWTDTAAIVPAGPWGTPDLAKNTPIPFSNEALKNTDIIRLRISLSNASGDCAIGCDNWKLRFAALAPGEACSGGTYGDVAADGGSCSGAWCVDDNTNYADGATLSDCSVGGNNCITTTNITGEAEDIDNTFNNPVAITLTQDGEWDVNLIANSLADATQYCFKVVDSSGVDLGGGYTNYAQLISTPGMSNLMRHGNFFDSTGSEQGYYWTD